MPKIAKNWPDCDTLETIQTFFLQKWQNFAAENFFSSTSIDLSMANWVSLESCANFLAN